MKEDCQSALKPFFTYVCGYCVFKHNICGDQLEVLDCMHDASSISYAEIIPKRRNKVVKH